MKIFGLLILGGMAMLIGNAFATYGLIVAIVHAVVFLPFAKMAFAFLSKDSHNQNSVLPTEFEEDLEDYRREDECLGMPGSVSEIDQMY